MRNPRGLIDHGYLIKKHHLDTTPPAPDSLFWKMWNAASSIARKTLNTEFIQGIKDGNLDPIKYGAFNVSDIYYCFSGAKDYGIASERATDQILKDYLQKKQESYDKYNTSACAAWRLSGPQSVLPTSTALHYAEFESSIAKGVSKEGNVEDPIFALIVMLPCEFLWAWLAKQLAPPAAGNNYASWITSNDYSSGAYAMGNFLQDYISRHPINEELAMVIYLTAMEYEYSNFYTATN